MGSGSSKPECKPAVVVVRQTAKQSSTINAVPSKTTKGTLPGEKEKVNPPSKQDGAKDAPKTDQEWKKEADAILKTHLALYKKTKELQSKPTNLTTAVLKEHVKAVKKTYSSFNDIPYDLKCTFRSKLFTPLFDSGTFALVCDTLKDGLETNAYLATTTTTNNNNNKNNTTTTDSPQGVDKDDRDEVGKNQVDLKEQKDQTDRPEEIVGKSETEKEDNNKVGSDKTKGVEKDTKDGPDKTKEADKGKKDGPKVDKEDTTDKKDGMKKGTDVAKGKEDGQKVDQDQVDILKDCFVVLNSFTDTSYAARKETARYKGFLPFLLDKLDQWCQPHMQGTTTDVEEHFVNKSLTLLYHIAILEDESHVENIRSHDGFFKVLNKYLSSKKDNNRLHCIGSLATLATEKEAETIAAESDIVKFLIKQLGEAVTNKTRASSMGWTIIGLGKVVKNLARNDANKQLLVKEGAVPLLTAGLKPEKQKSAADNSERKRCLECLWWLSFDAQNREVMVKNEDLMGFVVDIYKQGPKKNSHYPEAEGFVFQMRHTMRENNKYKDITDKLLKEKPKPEGPASTTSGHVMMSYQTQHRPMVKATCEFLKKKGFTMWMDIYDMAEGEESTLQTMAEAVEESSVVIVCFSDSYKNSAFCRAEAEYAFMRSKTIIPLKLEKGYSPDGWLGIILGSKFFYDFTKEGKELQDKRQKLLEAVQKAYALEAETSDGKKVTTKSTSQPVATPKSTMTFEDKVKTWSKKDLDAWRNKFNLKGKEVEALSGEDIIYLYSLKSEAPEVFHASVSTDLALTTISSKASLNRALDQLPDVAADSSQ